MSTYREIQQKVKQLYGRTVKTCWIAHVKELNGLNPRKAPNRLSSLVRKNPCPQDIRPIIEVAMRQLGML